jgi:predicted nucleic acid-binding protein
MAGELYLVDTNILIRWVRRESRDFRIVDASIEQLARLRSIPCYTSQNLGEFWNVLTRPADRNGYGLSPFETNRHAKDVEASFRLLPDSRETHEEWRHLLVIHGVSGVQVHDARLVASMHVHGVNRILTFNTKDFARFKDISAIHPLDLSSQASSK